MKTLWLLLLVPNLLARDITTRDGKTYHDCQVSRIYPDSICILFSGGGARIKLAELPAALQTEFGYDSQRAKAFEQAETAREQQERALIEAQRQQNQAQRSAQVTAASQSPGTRPGVQSGADYAAVMLASPALGANQALNQPTGGSR